MIGFTIRAADFAFLLILIRFGGGLGCGVRAGCGFSFGGRAVRFGRWGCMILCFSRNRKCVGLCLYTFWVFWGEDT